MNYKDLATEIKRAAKAKGVFIAELARLTDCGENLVTDWENGFKPTHNKTVKALFKIVNHLKINTDNFADFETIGGRIEAFRVKKQLTISELAELTNLSTMSIGNFEKNNRKPSAESLTALCNALKVMPTDIMFAEKKTTAPIRNGLVDLPKKLNTNQSDVKTMSSIELVKIINDMREDGVAELRHDHFMTKVEKVLGADAPKFRGIYLDAYKREKPCYDLPKREAHLMVMSENYKVQAAVYDRMVELEGKIENQQIQNQEIDLLSPEVFAYGKKCKEMFSGILKLRGFEYQNRVDKAIFNKFGIEAYTHKQTQLRLVK
jgi:transcriptional regulator with XRE-family HTH domain